MRPVVCVRAWGVLIICMLMGLFGCAGNGAGRPHPQANSGRDSTSQPAALLDLDGRPFELLDPKRHAVTVVVFTRTDCPISNRFAPEIARLYRAYHPRGVEFFLVYVDPEEQPDAIRRHLSEFGYPCRGLRDPGHALVHRCHASITPEAIVFGKDRAITYQGRINDLYVDLGQPRAAPTTHDLADAIESTALGRPVATPRTNAVGCLIADLERSSRDTARPADLHAE